MSKNKNYRSEAASAIHEMISDFHETGLVDKRTMRRFYESCLTPVEKLTPEQIKAIREATPVSQTVFARYLTRQPGHGQQVGTRREIAQQFHPQTPGAGKKQRIGMHRLNAIVRVGHA